jgi:hypothetical protein
MTNSISNNSNQSTQEHNTAVDLGSSLSLGTILTIQDKLIAEIEEARYADRLSHAVYL